MKKLLTVVVMAAGLLVAHKEVAAQSKMAYISTGELISVMPETRKADSSLQQLQAALYQNAQEKQEKLQHDIDKFNHDSTTMSDAVKAVKRQELQKLLQELSGEEQRIQQQLSQKRDELLEPIRTKAFNAIQAVAKEGGYGYVFEKDALIIAPPAEDILPQVAKKMNIKLPAGAGGAPDATTPKQ